MRKFKLPVPPRLRLPTLGLRAHLTPIAIVAGALLAFVAFRAAQRSYLQPPETAAITFFVFVALIVGISAVTPPAVSSRAVRIVCTALAVICGLFSLLYYPGFGVVEEAAYQATKPLFLFGRWVAVCAAIATWWRPSLAAVPCAYLIAAKAAVFSITQVRTGFLDYAPLAEVGLFLSFGIVASRVIRGPARDEPSMTFLFMCGVAIHFSNYFWSGWVKMRIGDNPLQWVWTNTTFDLALAGHNHGTLPLGSYTFIPLSWSFLPAIVIAANAITFSSQLASLFAIVNLRWIFFLTIVFDVMHVGIFFLSGINFWTWIMFNIAIVAAVAAMPPGPTLPLALRLLPCGIVILAPYLFNIAYLGWFDSRSIRDLHFVAITAGGAAHRVPFNYFLGNSYSFYFPGFIGWPHGGHYRTSVWGLAWNSLDHQAGRNCTRELGFPKNDDQATIDRLTKFLRAHHSYIVGHVDGQGRYPYDFFPHHHFTNPAYFREFYELDKRTIVRYDLVTESSCLSYEEGNFAKTIKKRSVTAIDVQ